MAKIYLSGILILLVLGFSACFEGETIRPDAKSKTSEAAFDPLNLDKKFSYWSECIFNEGAYRIVGDPFKEYFQVSIEGTERRLLLSVIDLQTGEHLFQEYSAQSVGVNGEWHIYKSKTLNFWYNPGDDIFVIKDLFMTRMFYNKLPKG